MNSTSYYSNSGLSFQASSTAARLLTALAPYDLKAEGEAGKYRCNSPLRPGSNSHAFTLIVHDGEHGVYFDHVTDDSGTLYDLAKQLELDLPAVRHPVMATKRAYHSLTDYAQAHGVSPAPFVAAGWSETTYQDRPALAFTTLTGTRYRFLDGDKPTYKSPVGYDCCWYGLPQAIQLAQESGQPLVICNGEASTVVGQHFGVAACAVTAGEKKALPANLLNALQAAYRGPVLVAFDCLDKGADAAPALAAQLRAAGWDARAVDLGLGKGGDLADFCRLHTTEAVTALANLPTLSGFQPTAATPSTTRHWQWIHADQLDSLPPVRWLIPDEIPEQALVVLFGPSGAGKSFIALDYSLRVAQEHPVLYIAAEGHTGYANRKIAWCKHHGVGPGQLYFPHDNTVIALLDPLVVQAFIASVTPLQPKFIVFDTLAWCMTGGDENSTSDMQRLITHCRQIQTATGATVLLVHHTGKNGSSERGSSALRGGADMMLEITNDDDVITLSCSKSKETEGFDDRHLARVTLETRPGETSCVWLPTDKVAHSQADKLSRQQREVLETLAAPLFVEVGARFVQLTDALPSISRSGLYKILNRLMATHLGYIAQGKKGEPFTITAAGQVALSTAQNRPVTGESTKSTPSPQLSPETPSPLSTVSTHASACRPGQDMDTSGQREPAVASASPEPCSPTEEDRATLKIWAEHTRPAPTDFVPAHQVFPNPDPARLQSLVRLHEQGYLERQSPTAPRYRLSSAGLTALGLRLVHLDLRNF